MENSENQIELVAINDIHILNPRSRSKAKFQLIVNSISRVGLKRPIKVSVAPEKTASNGKRFNLICGQGRLEAFGILGETHIPAMVVSLSEEDCYVQSLVENLARRKNTSLDAVKVIELLIERGYGTSAIAAKEGISKEYANGLVRLIKQGEERLYQAVEQGRIPVSVAVEIASTRDEDIQSALTEAYERDDLRGKRLSTDIKVVKERNTWGRRVDRTNRRGTKPTPANAMVSHYKRETDRQRTLIRRADLTEARLSVIRTGLRDLFSDRNFRTLLRAEGLDTIPTQLVEYVSESADIR